MSQLNSSIRTPTHVTHEGAPARHIDAYEQLKRSVLASLLWEGSFYESGRSIADRIRQGVHAVSVTDAAALAVQARTEYKLRHVPLLIARELARYTLRTGKLVENVIAEVIQRPDELAEFLAIYWNGVSDRREVPQEHRPLSAQVKRGLARAFAKFDAYQLGKYNRDKGITLRDVMFLVHPKPKNPEQAEVWKKLAAGTLESPDTWEVNLSAGADKKETFERLLRKNKLGYMALLRNLRNMEQTGVDEQLIRGQLLEGAARSKALPFRFLSAARAVPRWERVLDQAMQSAMLQMERLPGRTVLLVDVSYSMVGVRISKRSELDRLDAACALAALGAGICEDYRVFTFSNSIVEAPPRSGMALVDAIKRSQPNSGTYLGAAVKHVNMLGYDRLIVFTDEQSHDSVPNPLPDTKGYMVNVAQYENGVGYGPWTHINGFSEATMRYVQESEKG